MGMHMPYRNDSDGTWDEQFCEVEEVTIEELEQENERIEKMIERHKSNEFVIKSLKELVKILNGNFPNQIEKLKKKIRQRERMNELLYHEISY